MELTENIAFGAEMNAGNEGPRTHFGFRDVETDKKAALVRGVFDSVADRYDLMNDLMSAGTHRLWKASFIDQLRPRPGMHLLDVAGGTGDIALRFCEAGGERVTVCDINQSMVEVGRDRMIDLNRLDGIDWTVGDAEALPLPDGSVDAYTIAFGLRNVTHIDTALSEACRVLRPGGRFMCLDFSHVASPILVELYDRFSFKILPLLGRIVANDGEAYRYLVESIRRFPSQEELSARMTMVGFEQVSYRNLSRGIAAIHLGWRI
jgi:demethylmenaquinone methyltransferase/2-methoxy-6-polyprenyl-1,4-benzoquinol methylase